MPKPSRTRTPSGIGGPESLQETYGNQREDSRRAAITILAELDDRSLPLTKANWDKVNAKLNQPCSWRTTYKAHLSDLFSKRRSSSSPASSVQMAAMRKSLSSAMACVKERDAEIQKLIARIEELEEDNRRMSRGTVPRRRRKSVQGRQNDTGARGSD